jgi:hypothetical protein
MKYFRELRKLKNLSNYQVIIYDATIDYDLESETDQVYNNILPVGLDKKGNKTYTGLLTKYQRNYFDNVFTMYGCRLISDYEKDNDTRQIFIHLY